MHLALPEIFLASKNQFRSVAPFTPHKITLLRSIKIFYISPGESYLKCFSEYTIATSGIATPVSTNPRATILFKIADAHEAKKHNYTFSSQKCFFLKIKMVYYKQKSLYRIYNIINNN